jgi:Xaa-Pro aminopeptidase
MRNTELHSRRLKELRSKLDEWEVDALFIGDASNRRWLSGFTGSAGQLLVTSEAATLSTDFRYWERVAAEAPVVTLFKHKRSDHDTATFLSSGGAERIGFSPNHMTVSMLSELEGASGAEWIPLKNFVEQLRAIKDASEIESMRSAAAIGDRAMARFNELARPGVSERWLAWELEKQMRENGAEGVAFPVIVASGPNSALPHHHPGDRVLAPGDVIVVDLGAVVRGYSSDLTRTFLLGNDADGRFEPLYQLVMKAHDAATQSARPGMSARELDGVARDLIREGGHGDDFGHGLGHGVGLDVHEKPSLSSRPSAEQEILSAGMTVTIEPGVYLQGWGGIRIEDLILLTDGGSELLSRCPYSPRIPIL